MARPSLTTQQVQARLKTTGAPGYRVGQLGAAAKVKTRPGFQVPDPVDDIPPGRIRIFEVERPALQVTAISMGGAFAFTSDGFGGFEPVDLVTGRPTADYTPPSAQRLTGSLMFDDVGRRQSIEDDCSRLERWASTPTLLRVAGMIPRRAGPLVFGIARGGLTVNTDPKRSWWVSHPGIAQFRLRQGYELTLTEIARDELADETVVAKKRRSIQARKAAKPGGALAAGVGAAAKVKTRPGFQDPRD